MCLGRIPLFVDTECVLPFDAMVDWPSRMAWIAFEELDTMPGRLVAFDAALDAAGRAELQANARTTWTRWLSPEGFFTTLAETLE